MRDALAVLERAGLQIAIVVDGDGRLLATVTDGDVRRGLLDGAELSSPVSAVMNATPTTVQKGEPKDAVRALIRKRRFKHLPVVDQGGRLTDLLLADDLFGLTPRETRVVLMAGGLGTRLRPLTETVPKPMIPVGGKPMLEQIVREFAAQGFERFSISVNYKKEMVQSHFGDGSAFGVEIEYLEETERRGTAGALSLLPERPDAPFVVMNGDVLVSLRFEALLERHAASEAAGTLVVREHSHEVPYGVVRTDGDYMTDLVEKPTERYFVNAGIYVLSPEALDHVPEGEMYDMPTLLSDLKADGGRIAVFPLRDYWRDVGRMQDLEAARSEFDGVFRE